MLAQCPHPSSPIFGRTSVRKWGRCPQGGGGLKSTERFNAPRPGTRNRSGIGNGLDRLLFFNRMKGQLPFPTCNYLRFRKKVGISRSSLLTEGRGVCCASLG